MGGVKKKIVMEKIEKKDSRNVAFSQRRRGLYNKASKLCLLSGAKIAILATPVSSQSNVSFYSFGHSSVDSVVSAFLQNQRPRDDNIAARKRLGFWWEDEGLAKSENSKELSDALDSISSMLQTLQGLQSEAVESRKEPEDLQKKKKDHVVSHGTHQELDQNQALKFQSCSPSNCIQDDSPANFEGFMKNNEEEDQIVAISDKNSNNNNIGLLGKLDGCSDTEAVEEGVIHRDFEEDNPHLSDLDENQLIASSDNNRNSNALTGNLGGYNEEQDPEQFFDFLMNCEDLSMNLEGLLDESTYVV